MKRGKNPLDENLNLIDDVDPMRTYFFLAMLFARAAAGSCIQAPDCASFDTFADLLVWRAQESGTENWVEVITGGSGSPEICEIRNVNFDWNPGFRVGLGYGLNEDRWDTQFYYTWFRTNGDDRVSSSPGSIFSPFLGNFYVDNPTGAGIRGLTYEKASIQWTINFNVFDWDLGWKLRVGQVLFRPFIGVKGAGIQQSIHSKWENPTVPPLSEPFSTGVENLRTHFWGVGPSGGVNTKWNVFTVQNHAVNLLADFSGAIMYGHWTFEDIYTNDILQKISVILPDNDAGAYMLKTFLGIGWDANFCCDQFLFSTKLGFEMQFWLDQLQLYLFDTGRLNNELTLQGGTLEFLFDF